MAELEELVGLGRRVRRGDHLDEHDEARLRELASLFEHDPERVVMASPDRASCRRVKRELRKAEKRNPRPWTASAKNHVQPRRERRFVRRVSPEILIVGDRHRLARWLRSRAPVRRGPAGEAAPVVGAAAVVPAHVRPAD